MAGWHHRFSGREFEQTQGDSEGQMMEAKQKGYHTLCQCQVHLPCSIFLLLQLISPLFFPGLDILHNI